MLGMLSGGNAPRGESKCSGKNRREACAHKYPPACPRSEMINLLSMDDIQVVRPKEVGTHSASTSRRGADQIDSEAPAGHLWTGCDQQKCRVNH